MDASSSRDSRHALIAVATDASGRTIFVSIDDREFSQIPHFPLSLEEARALAAEASGPQLIREQLIAYYSGKVALLRLTHEGHKHPIAASTATPGGDRRLAIPPSRADVEGPAGDDAGLTCEHPSTRQGVVVGRICNEHLTIRCDQGGTVSVRVGRRLGAQLDIGQPALVVFDDSGVPITAEPIARVFVRGEHYSEDPADRAARERAHPSGGLSW